MCMHNDIDYSFAITNTSCEQFKLPDCMNETVYDVFRIYLPNILKKFGTFTYKSGSPIIIREIGIMSTKAWLSYQQTCLNVNMPSG